MKNYLSKIKEMKIKSTVFISTVARKRVNTKNFLAICVMIVAIFMANSSSKAQTVIDKYQYCGTVNATTGVPISTTGGVPTTATSSTSFPYTAYQEGYAVWYYTSNEMGGTPKTLLSMANYITGFWNASDILSLKQVYKVFLMNVATNSGSSQYTTLAKSITTDFAGVAPTVAQAEAAGFTLVADGVIDFSEFNPLLNDNTWGLPEADRTWLEKTFNTPFNYTGGDLIVMVCKYEDPNINSSVANTWLCNKNSYAEPFLSKMNNSTGSINFRGCRNNRSNAPINASSPATGQTDQGRIHARFEFSVDMEYIETIFTKPATTSLSDREYLMLNANIRTQGMENPLDLEKLEIDLSKMPASAVKINNLKIYSTATSNTFAQDSLIATVANPTVGGNLEVTLSEPFTLSAGDNNFWILFETDYSTENNASLQTILSSVTISETKEEIESSFSNEVKVSYNEITVSEAGNYVWCSTEPEKEFSVTPSGSIVSTQWEKWNSISEEYELVPDNSTNIIGITSQEVANGITKCRFTAFAPAGMEDVSREFGFEVQSPVTSATITINGEIPDENVPLIFCIGQDPVEVVGTYEGGQPLRFEWQYEERPGSYQPISLVDMPTAWNSTLEFIANSKLIGSRVRLAIYSADACNNAVVYSNTFAVQTSKENTFLQQPPISMGLCENERLYVVVNYDGSDPIEAGWYKDGAPIITSTGEHLTDDALEITNVSRSDEGTYYYLVKALGCGGVIETVTSEKMALFINPKPEIINIMSVSKAKENGVAILQVEGNHSIDPAQENAFQWYRHDFATNRNIKLEENYNTIGVNTNTLMITPVTDDIYTWNADYYFCTLNGLCGGTDTSNPIYLLPISEIAIVKHPVNLEVCKNSIPTTVSLTVEAFTAEDNIEIGYQWYEGSKKLENDAEFSGVNTFELNIEVSDANRTYENFYCRIWKVNIDDPDVDYLQTNEATVTFLDAPEITASSDAAITLKVGDELVLSVTTNNSKNETFEWKFTDENENETILDAKTSELKIENISLENQGEYTVTVTNACGYAEMKFNVTVEEAEQISPTSIANIVSSPLQISPNPASNYVNLTFDADREMNYSIELMDLKGELIYTHNELSKISQNIVNIDLSPFALSNGTYFLRINFDEKVVTKSFVITK